VQLYPVALLAFVYGQWKMNFHSGYMGQTSYHRVWIVQVTVVELMCKVSCLEMAAWTHARNVGIVEAEEAVRLGKESLDLQLKILNVNTSQGRLPDEPVKLDLIYLHLVCISS
jgi:hypothetical protein